VRGRIVVFVVPAGLGDAVALQKLVLVPALVVHLGALYDPTLGIVLTVKVGVF
jgi:hypothetical protein